MDTRELRYFVAVAEELHFGRAAERLRISQPPLSRAVQQLERRLGVALLERGSRGVTLTPAGAVLLHEGRVALGAVDAAERRTVRAAGDRPQVVLATKAGASSELLAKLLDAYAAEPGSVEVEVVLCAPGEQEQVLRDGRADVALLHRPYDSLSGLDVEELSTEGQVLVIRAGHPMTRHREIRVAQIAEESGLPLPRWPRRDGTYPDGPGPRVHDNTQILQLVALGRTCVLLPESVAALLSDDLATIPVVDATPVTTVIAWPPHSRSKPVADLVRTATRL